MITGLLLLGAMAGWAPDTFVADPLAPARAGMLLCHFPDVAAKKCDALTRYTRNADGSYHSFRRMFLADNPLATVEMYATLDVRGDAICDPNWVEDVLDGQLRIEGLPVSKEQAADFRARTAKVYAPYAGKEFCTRHVKTAEGLRGVVSVAGEPQSDMGGALLWVRPEDGYSVGMVAIPDAPEET